MKDGEKADANWCMLLIEKEYLRATELYPPFFSPHDGLDIIDEEMDEFKKAVRHGTGEQVYHEAIQLAAMVLRYLVEIGAQSAIKK